MVEAYNPTDIATLIKTKSCPGGDLSGANFKGANLHNAIMPNGKAHN